MSSRFRRSGDVFGRETVEFELPRFLLRLFEHQVERANAEAGESDCVTVNNLVELHLAEHISLADLAMLDREIPGVAAAAEAWLNDAKT